MGCRIPQAQGGFPLHPRLHLRLLSVVLWTVSPPSPLGTSVITGHDQWIVCASPSRLRSGGQVVSALMSSRIQHPSAGTCWRAVLLSCVTEPSGSGLACQAGVSGLAGRAWHALHSGSKLAGVLCWA